MIPSVKTPLELRDEDAAKDLNVLRATLPDDRKEDFEKLLKAITLLKESGFNYWFIPFFPEEGEEFTVARIFNSYQNFLKFDKNQELTEDSLIDVICFNTSLFKIIINSFFPEFLDPDIDNSEKFVEFTRLMKMISNYEEKSKKE